MRIEIPTCGDEDCDCADLSIEGTVEEVLQGIFDDALIAFDSIMELVVEQAAMILHLNEAISILAGVNKDQMSFPEDFGNGTDQLL